jgi:hypothetical protein
MDEWVEITLELSTYHLNVQMEPNEDGEATVEGWVNLIKKRPGEVVSVAMTVDADQLLWGTCDPSSVVFQELGTKYFNVSVWVREDTPGGNPLHMSIGAQASSRTASDTFRVELNVLPVHETIVGEADLTRPPGRVGPGGSSTGEIEIFNEGTRPTIYSLVLMEDPDDVVKSVAFFADPELGNNYIEKREFQVVVRSDAEVGSHFVKVGLLAYQDPQETIIVDTITFQLQVVEPDTTFDWGSATVIIIVLVTIAAVVTIVIRKRR